MSPSDVETWLDAGIAAVRSGDNAMAREMLMKVVDADDHNEQAWLWLGAVGATEEERRICLENVLALNPDNVLARKRLARLTSPTHYAKKALTERVRGVRADLTNDKPPGSREGLSRAKIEPPGPRQYGDVWDTDDDICAYCAATVDTEDKRCPSCGRSLVKLSYRYSATAVLHVFWLLLFANSLVLGFQAIFKLQVEQHDTGAVLHALLAVSLVFLTVGVLMRLFLAHIGATFIMVLVSILAVYNLLVPFDPSALGMDGVDPALRGFTTSFFSRLGLLLDIVHVALAGVALFYATMRAGPEFERVAVHSFARTVKGLHTAADYNMTARRLKQEGKWASAVLHWQRASAIQPSKVVYQRNLARAYFQLGFLERGTDLIESALRLPMEEPIHLELEGLLKWARRQATNNESKR